MNGRTMGLPIITNPEPRSLSYFKYAKNAMKVGDMNPIYSGVQMPYHPYHLPSNTDPLYKSQQLLNNPNVGEHPYLNTYPLPPIGKNKEMRQIYLMGSLAQIARDCNVFQHYNFGKKQKLIQIIW